MLAIRPSLWEREGVSVMWRYKLQHLLIYELLLCVILPTDNYTSICIDYREQLVDLPDGSLLSVTLSHTHRVRLAIVITV